MCVCVQECSTEIRRVDFVFPLFGISFLYSMSKLEAVYIFFSFIPTKADANVGGYHFPSFEKGSRVCCPPFAPDFIITIRDFACFMVFATVKTA